MTILLRIEHLEESLLRVSLIVGANLINLIEHHHRIVRATLLQGGDDASRHGSKICATMSADLRFIVKST